MVAGIGATLLTLLGFSRRKMKVKENKSADKPENQEEKKCLNIKKIMDEKLSEIKDLKGRLATYAKEKGKKEVRSRTAGTKTGELLGFLEKKEKEYLKLKDLYEKCMASISIKTKFVLHGGFDPAKGNQEDDAFFKEILKGTTGTVKILLVYFAEREEMLEQRVHEDHTEFNKNKGLQNLQFKIASEKNFIKDCTQADIIYLHGGRTVKIMEAMWKFKDLNQVFKGKIVAGDSAGVNALGKIFYSRNSKEIGKGLGILPFKTVVHYKAGDPDPLKDVEPKLSTMLLREYETKVFYY